MKKKNELKNVFFAPAIGLIFGNLGAGKDKDNGGSGLIAPFGIDIALLVGLSIGFFKTLGIIITPGVAIGRMGFLVIGIGIHWKQRIGFGIVLPLPIPLNPLLLPGQIW